MILLRFRRNFPQTFWKIWSKKVIIWILNLVMTEQRTSATIRLDPPSRPRRALSSSFPAVFSDLLLRNYEFYDVLCSSFEKLRALTLLSERASESFRWNERMHGRATIALMNSNVENMPGRFRDEHNRRWLGREPSPISEIKSHPFEMDTRQG